MPKGTTLPLQQAVSIPKILYSSHTSHICTVKSLRHLLFLHLYGILKIRVSGKIFTAFFPHHGQTAHLLPSGNVLISAIPSNPSSGWFMHRRNASCSMLFIASATFIPITPYFASAYHSYNAHFRHGILPFLAGPAGFEPANAGVKVLCLTAWQ